jgi:integrase
MSLPCRTYLYDMATVKFYLKNPKQGGRLRKDEVSIVAKFTASSRQRFELPVKEKIAPADWDFKAQEVKTKFKYHIDFNERLDDFKNELLNMYRKHDGSFEDFRMIAFAWAKGDTNEKKSLWSGLSKFIDQYRNEKDTKTVLKFITLETELKKLNPALTFSQLNNEFYDDFKNHLSNRKVIVEKGKIKWPNDKYPYGRLVNKGDYWGIEEDLNFKVGVDTPVPLFDSTIYRYFKDLTNFLRWATIRDYPVNPCFKKWEIIVREYDDVVTFNEEELVKLLNHSFSKPQTQIAIDYLLIECFCGQRVSDIKRFDVTDLHDDTWTFTRYKGRRLRANSGKVSLRFIGYMRTAYLLLSKYDFKMPAIEEQTINELVKEGCKEVGITEYTYQERWSGNKLIRIDGPKNEFISTHTGRRTFITLALSRGIPQKVVMELTGITSTHTLKKYEGKTSVKTTNEYMEKLGELVPMKLRKIG